MRDLAFDIIGRDRSGAAFAGASRNARRFRDELRQIDRESRRVTQRSRQLSYQLIDSGQALASIPTMGIYALQNLGFQFAQIGQLYMGQGGMGAALRDSIGQVGRFAAKMGPAIVATAALAAVFGGMTYEINKTTAVSVSFGDTVLATFQVLGGYIMETLQPAINAIAPWFASAWESIVTGFKTFNNALIAGWKTVFDAAVIAWDGLPAALGDLGIRGGNALLDGIEAAVNKALPLIKSLIKIINPFAAVAGVAGFDITGVPDEISVGRMKNPYEGAASDFAGRVKSAALENSAQDFMGTFFGDIRGQAINNALAGEKDKKKGGKSEAEKLAERYQDIVRGANQATDAFNRQRDALFMSQEAAAEMRHQSELLNKAQNAGITLTAKQTTELMGLGSAMAAAEIAYQKTKEALDFAKSTVKGFISDLRSGLEQGKSFWESFGDAALGVLNRITDRLLNQVLDALFQVSRFNFGGGGILASLFGGGFNPTPGGFASMLGIPGFASGTDSAPGGWSWVGESGPELMKLPGGARIMSSGRSRQMTAANANGGSLQIVVVHKHEKDGNLRSFVEQVSGRVSGQVVAAAAPSIIQRSTVAAGEALSRGNYDEGMSKYGTSRQAAVR